MWQLSAALQGRPGPVCQLPCATISAILMRCDVVVCRDLSTLLLPQSEGSLVPVQDNVLILLLQQLQPLMGSLFHSCHHKSPGAHNNTQCLSFAVFKQKKVKREQEKKCDQRFISTVAQLGKNKDVGFHPVPTLLTVQFRKRPVSTPSELLESSCSVALQG